MEHAIFHGYKMIWNPTYVFDCKPIREICLIAFRLTFRMQVVGFSETVVRKVFGMHSPHSHFFVFSYVLFICNAVLASADTNSRRDETEATPVNSAPANRCVCACMTTSTTERIDKQNIIYLHYKLKKEFVIFISKGIKKIQCLS